MEKNIIWTRSNKIMKSNSFNYFHSISNLDEKLRNVSKIFSKIGIGASILAFLSVLVTYFYFGNNIIYSDNAIQVIFDALLYGLVIIVVALPAGLSLVVTLALAFSVYKMKEENTIIKNIEACENMACIDTICTDYIGFLTKNEMKINCIFMEDNLIDSKGLPNFRDEVDLEMFEFFKEACSVNSTAFSADKDGVTHYIGDPLECSIIKFLTYLHIDYSKLRNDPMRPIIDCSPVSSDSKFSYAVIEMDDRPDQVRIYVKGSNETILDRIGTYIGKEKTVQTFMNHHYDKLKKTCKAMTDNGNFPLILCYRDMNRDTYYKIKDSYVLLDLKMN
jgi:magnesium-transporting ATPase (P-type)